MVGSGEACTILSMVFKFCRVFTSRVAARSRNGHLFFFAAFFVLEECLYCVWSDLCSVLLLFLCFVVVKHTGLRKREGRKKRRALFLNFSDLSSSWGFLFLSKRRALFITLFPPHQLSLDFVYISTVIRVPAAVEACSERVLAACC